jgi:ketosteroid isomerase-like protein
MPQWTFKFVIIALGAILFLSVGCGDQSAPTVAAPRPTRSTQRTPTPVPATDEEAVRQLINAECEAVVQQDIDRLQAMWAPDGIVTDARNTPDNTSDDSTWKGWDAIRDRYVNIVFPSNPTFCEHPDTQVQVNGDTATATSGVKIGVTNAPNSNKWEFKKGSSGWQITSLTYNLTPNK